MIKEGDCGDNIKYVWYIQKSMQVSIHDDQHVIMKYCRIYMYDISCNNNNFNESSIAIISIYHITYIYISV